MTEAPTARVPDHRHALAVEMRGITKRYPGVVANRDVTFDARKGEVHCLLGENGAGKSTLMGILSGMVRPDSGEIRLDGQVARITTPGRALSLGIGTVYQHLTLVPALTVLENLLLGQRGDFRIDAEAARARLADLVETLGIELDHRAVTGQLALGQQQYVEIIKALWRKSNVLVLDEPTSMLTPQGVDHLHRTLIRLRESGLAIIFITHKLHEAIRIGDRISVLKGGQLMHTFDEEDVAGPPSLVRERVIEMMFGKSAAAPDSDPDLRPQSAGRKPYSQLTSEPRLRLEAVSAEDHTAGSGLYDVSLAARPGEVLGIAGVDGNGQRELAEVIAGQKASQGTIWLDGERIDHLSIPARQRRGLRYVTDDRRGEGTVGSLSVALNLVLKRIGQAPFWRQGRTRRSSIGEHAQRLIASFDIRPPRSAARAGTLSGGNIQKVLLARELSLDPKVVVYNKPTNGLDLKTAESVRARIREQSDGEVTALVISTELDELLALSDRIAVMYQGRVTAVVPNGPDAGETVGELMLGGRGGS